MPFAATKGEAAFIIPRLLSLIEIDVILWVALREALHGPILTDFLDTQSDTPASGLCRPAVSFERAEPGQAVFSPHERPLISPHVYGRASANIWQGQPLWTVHT